MQLQLSGPCRGELPTQPKPRLAQAFAVGANAVLVAGVLLASPHALAAGPNVDPPVISGKRSPSVQDRSAVKSNAASPMYWYDGARRREVAIDAERLVDFDTTRDVATGGKPAIVDRDSAEAKSLAARTASPLFVDPVSGQVAGALPGGVIVQTSTPMNEDESGALAEAFGTRVRHAIGGSRTLWVFESPPGTDALQLANRIHESGRVVSASPDWWRPRVTK